MDMMALATLAGNALVAAAVTDAWEDVRRQIARLFGRGQPDPQIERRLDATRQALERVPPGGLQQARADQARDWQARFGDFLADYPDAASELDAGCQLRGQEEAAAPVSAPGTAVTAVFGVIPTNAPRWATCRHGK
jgi:hypothetical protein